MTRPFNPPDPWAREPLSPDDKRKIWLLGILFLTLLALPLLVLLVLWVLVWLLSPI